jgi:hypothetical protein
MPDRDSELTSSDSKLHGIFLNDKAKFTEMYRSVKQLMTQVFTVKEDLDIIKAKDFPTMSEMTQAHDRLVKQIESDMFLVVECCKEIRREMTMHKDERLRSSFEKHTQTMGMVESLQETVDRLLHQAEENTRMIEMIKNVTTPRTEVDIRIMLSRMNEQITTGFDDMRSCFKKNEERWKKYNEDQTNRIAFQNETLRLLNRSVMEHVFDDINIQSTEIRRLLKIIASLLTTSITVYYCLLLFRNINKILNFMFENYTAIIITILLASQAVKSIR